MGHIAAPKSGKTVAPPASTSLIWENKVHKLYIYKVFYTIPQVISVPRPDISTCISTDSTDEVGALQPAHTAEESVPAVEAFYFS